MAHIQLTRGNGEVAVDKESSVVVVIHDDGDAGTGVTVAIEGASVVEVTAVILSMESAVERIKQRHPEAALVAEFKKQADELKKEVKTVENGTDD